jgi:hypothetical protein
MQPAKASEGDFAIIPLTLAKSRRSLPLPSDLGIDIGRYYIRVLALVLSPTIAKAQGLTTQMSSSKECRTYEELAIGDSATFRSWANNVRGDTLNEDRLRIVVIAWSQARDLCHPGTQLRQVSIEPASVVVRGVSTFSLVAPGDTSGSLKLRANSSTIVELRAAICETPYLNVEAHFVDNNTSRTPDDGYVLVSSGNDHTWRQLKQGAAPIPRPFADFVLTVIGFYGGHVYMNRGLQETAPWPCPLVVRLERIDKD